MQHNEYRAAEVIEMGEAQEIIRGRKTAFVFFDSSGDAPFDRMWEWWDI